MAIFISLNGWHCIHVLSAHALVVFAWNQEVLLDIYIKDFYPYEI